MNNRAPIGKRQQGMSLIEMMIAMTISLIVIGAVSGVYLSTSRNYTQDELLSRMQENARYALHVLAEDLSMAGYWGPSLVSGNDINTTVALASADDCEPSSGSGNWAVSLTNPVEVEALVTSGSDANNLYTCIDAAGFEDLDGSGTDILVVKRVEGDDVILSSDDDDDIFIRTDGANAILFKYDSSSTTPLDIPAGPNTSDWRYRANIYYIRNHFLTGSGGNPADTIPTLVRSKLTDGTIDTDPEEVAQGIEYFHVIFGVDNDSDGDTTADYYTANPDPGDLDNLTSARIYVLARSVSEDFNYDNNKTYQLGNITRTFNDNFYRRVFTTTVTLRNPRNRMSASGS